MDMRDAREHLIIRLSIKVLPVHTLSQKMRGYSKAAMTPYTYSISFSMCGEGAGAICSSELNQSTSHGNSLSFANFEVKVLISWLYACKWLCGAMVARSTPDRKVGGSIPSRVTFYFCIWHCTKYILFASSMYQYVLSTYFRGKVCTLG